MTDAEIRSKVIERLKDGRLPRRLPGPLPRDDQPTDLGSITMGGDQCSACDGSEPHHTYTGPSGEKNSFHEKCEQIWNEERVKPIRN
jgi:hypothetical protein